MKRKCSIIAFILVGLLAVAFVQLQKMAKVSDIVSDEAKWDVQDSFSDATQMKVLIMKDGMVARYVSEDESTYVCNIQDSFYGSKG